MVTVNVVSNISICMENIGNKKKSKKTIQKFAHLVDVLRESPKIAKINSARINSAKINYFMV